MKSTDLNSKQWKSSIKRILIIYWGFFGDLIITTPFLEYLRKGFPKAKIAYIIGGIRNAHKIHQSFKHGSIILENNPYLDKCIKSDVSILGELLTEKPYDLVIDLCGSKSTFSTVLSHISGAKLRIWGRFRELPKEFFYAWRLNNGKWADPIKIMLNKKYCRAKRFLEIIRYLGIKTNNRVIPRIYLSRKERGFSRRFFKRIIKKNNFIVGMHPGGRLLYRLWNTKNYSLLADKLIKEFNAKVIVFYGPGEKKIAHRVCKNSQHKLIKVFQKNTRRYISLISCCHLFITTDGGPLHIALALGIPCIGMFGNKYNRLYWYGQYPKNLFFPIAINSYTLKRNEKEVGRVFKKAKFILQYRLKNRCRPGLLR